MLWPFPSPSPSRLIDTPVAGPVTTTWKDSNSFLAAAMAAVAFAVCGGCACGRIFTAAGAVQTWAASEALPARKATVAAAIWESFIAASPWLAASRNGGCFSLRSANEEDVPPLPSTVSCSRGSSVRLSGERGQTSPLGLRPRTRASARNTCGGSPSADALREKSALYGLRCACSPAERPRRQASRRPPPRRREAPCRVSPRHPGRRISPRPLSELVGHSPCSARSCRLGDSPGGRLLARGRVLMFRRCAGPPARPPEGRVEDEGLGTREPRAAGPRLAGAARRPVRVRGDGALPGAAVPGARAVVPGDRAAAARAGALGHRARGHRRAPPPDQQAALAGMAGSAARGLLRRCAALAHLVDRSRALGRRRAAGGRLPRPLGGSDGRSEPRLHGAGRGRAAPALLRRARPGALAADHRRRRCHRGADGDRRDALAR